MSFDDVSGKCVCVKCHRSWYARQRGKNGRFIMPKMCIRCKSYNWSKKG